MGMKVQRRMPASGELIEVFVPPQVDQPYPGYWGTSGPQPTPVNIRDGCLLGSL